MPAPRPFDKVKFHCCPRGERAISLSRNTSKVHKNLLSLLRLNKATPLGKPPYPPFPLPNNGPPCCFSLSGPICGRDTYGFHCWCVPGRVGIISTPFQEGA